MANILTTDDTKYQLIKVKSTSRWGNSSDIFTNQVGWVIHWSLLAKFQYHAKPGYGSYGRRFKYEKSAWDYLQRQWQIVILKSL